VRKDDKASSRPRHPPDMSTGPQLVENLISDKLVSALRTVAAGQTLVDLNPTGSSCRRGATDHRRDLKPNGLTLEAVTISNLDQAPIDALRPDSNVFDCGRRATIPRCQCPQAERKRSTDTERRSRA